MKLSKWEIIRFDKGQSTSIHIAFYDTEITAQTVADAINALDRESKYGRAVVLEPQVFTQRLAITSPAFTCCDKCDQPV